MVLLTAAALTLIVPAASGQGSQPGSQPGFQQLAAQAASARAAGQLADAVTLYGQALKINPGWAAGWWYLGQLDYAGNNYAPAVAAFTHYLGLEPKASPAMALRGLCEFRLGEYAASLSDVQSALAAGAANDPRNSQILRFHEGLLLTKLGRFEEALAAYRWFAQQHLANQEMLVAVGLAALRAPELPEEAPPAMQAEALLAGQAIFPLLAKDTADATQALHRFSIRYPTAANMHYTFGYLLYPIDEDAAIGQFRKEIAVNPGSPIAYSMLAWILLMEHDPASALPVARKAVAEAPSSPLAQLCLGSALVDTGDVKSGLPLLESARASNPNDLEVRLALARAYSEAGQVAAARRERAICIQMAKAGRNPAAAMGGQRMARPEGGNPAN